ncbi:sigma-54-dependent Fis family transcriptional regulator [Neptunomonas sp. XY-337]|uniref:sigma-54-dependent Fis family transcriptional regulator n=1 Tax=Neptunomonas sp. XY-337 TaxID=2561897 RepID=UPI0010AA8C2C|nr:sigma-54-dependent Fis family transcriptional regulator [Neptunomonas sp. XY-337]
MKHQEAILAPADIARQHLAQDGELPNGLLRSEIADSWQRSLAAGLACNAPLELDNPSKDQVDDLKAANRTLIETAQPEVAQLVDYFHGVGGLVMLADSDANLLTVRGDKRHMDSASRYALEPGANWHEGVRGTNALGTVVVEKAPIMIKGREHFLDQVGHLSCCSAPIHDTQGGLLGVLDLTSPTEGELPPNLSLVQQAVRSIENRMFSGQFQQQIVISLHSRPEYLRSSWQGLLAMELDGYIQAANEQVCQLLGRKREQLVGKHLEELFGVKPEALLTTLHRKGRGQLRMRSGDFVCELVSFPARINSYQNRSTKPSPPKRETPAPSTLQALQLDDLAGQDPRLKKGVRMGSRALSHELPVLIQGETGTGKEVMAKSLHLDSRRSQGPFVAVNCAALPESLIESELFGYREGAFTGSRKGGMIGKLQQAQGGTLFLDEIGDMPLPLQARLLRVLQERVVSPLGGGEEVALDIAVICASHRDLKALVAEGSFREDLYYRLNGVCLRLPALRERADKQNFICQFLQKLAPDGRQISVNSGLFEQLLAYRWPGNVRQLETMLRVAVAFMEPDEHCIDHSHISDDFLEELNGVPPVVQPQSGGHTLKQRQQQQITDMLARHSGNMTATATALGISRATLYRRLKAVRAATD